MKILLTGASGMVGRNILDHQLALTHQIFSPSSSRLNLLNGIALREYINDKKPDMVIHCAGVVGGIQSSTTYSKFLIDNMLMGINVVKESQNFGIPRLMNISSSCIYPYDCLDAMSEDQILSGKLDEIREGYCLAKASILKLCEYINKENPSLNYKSVIPCNLYGRYDKFDSLHAHMIPSVISRIINAKNRSLDFIEIWGDGTARREFMYAGDAADFIFYAIQNFDCMPQNLNLGIGKDYTIKEYNETIANIVGYKGKFILNSEKPVGSKRRLLCTNQLNNFGWTHKTDLKDGISKTIDYYLQEKLNESI
jgi:GDP-L-fucose synthase